LPEAFRNGKHVVNVNVEGDAFCGALLARKAVEAASSQSGLWRPIALICDLVDCMRAAGLGVRQGRGHKWLPHRAVDAGTVWGFTPHARAGEGRRTQSEDVQLFLDGSKSAIECTAVCNATGLAAPPTGSAIRRLHRRDPVSVSPARRGWRAAPEGAGRGDHRSSATARRSTTTFASALRRSRADQYIRNCFKEYMVRNDSSGRYACLYKRWHLIGLEVGISVASVGLRGEATGSAIGFNADVVATAKRDLKPGEMLDGEGGYTVWGKLFPASKSIAVGGLPLGLAHGVKLVRAVAQGHPLTWADVAIDENLTAYRIRREMEALFAPKVAGAQRAA
jgi:predicted homoserine dehydrogenase-like protein